MLVEQVTLIWLGEDVPFRDWGELEAHGHQHLDQTAERLRRDPTTDQVAAAFSVEPAGGSGFAAAAGCIVTVAD